MNSADYASRGKQRTRWPKDPTFLYEKEEDLPKDPFLNLNDETDLEIEWTVNCKKLKISVVV